jgi:hypothetical protein
MRYWPQRGRSTHRPPRAADRKNEDRFTRSNGVPNKTRDSRPMSEKPAQERAFHPPLSFAAFQYFSISTFLSLLPISAFQHFSISAFSSLSPSLSLPRAPTVLVHECPCTGRWNLFHSHRTLALSLDTDPGVVPNQKQGAKPVLTHINESYQTSCTSKLRRKLLEINGCIDGFRVLRVQRPVICA